MSEGASLNGPFKKQDRIVLLRQHWDFQVKRHVHSKGSEAGRKLCASVYGYCNKWPHTQCLKTTARIPPLILVLHLKADISRAIVFLKIWRKNGSLTLPSFCWAEAIQGNSCNSCNTRHVLTGAALSQYVHMHLRGLLLCKCLLWVSKLDSSTTFFYKGIVCWL